MVAQNNVDMEGVAQIEVHGELFQLDYYVTMIESQGYLFGLTQVNPEVSLKSAPV